MYIKYQTDVDIDVDEIIDEIETDDLVAELEKRKVPMPANNVKVSLSTLPNYSVRTYLQDLFDTSHTISDDDLLQTIKNTLK